MPLRAPSKRVPTPIQISGEDRTPGAPERERERALRVCPKRETKERQLEILIRSDRKWLGLGKQEEQHIEQPFVSLEVQDHYLNRNLGGGDPKGNFLYLGGAQVVPNIDLDFQGFVDLEDGHNWYCTIGRIRGCGSWHRGRRTSGIRHRGSMTCSFFLYVVVMPFGPSSFLLVARMLLQSW